MQAQQQPSPTVSTGPRRSSPPAGQVSRLLPTPPHPNPPNILDSTPERRITPPPPPQHSHSQPIINTHYPRPMPRTAPPQFLTKFEMTDELLAEIERADQQQSQNQITPHAPAPHPYTSGYLPRSESPPAPKDPNVERIRAMERSSPNGPDNGQQRRTREPQATRESPKARDRQPTSPIVASFAAQVQAHTPERRGSPLVPGPGENLAGYTAQYSRDSPPVLRRPSNAVNPESRSNLSLASQTPPLQAIARTPDRSLPVQEEAEDEFRIPSKNGPGPHESWKNNEQSVSEHNSRRPPPSPTPSSDLHPEGNSQRYDINHMHGGRESRTGHRGEDGKPLLEKDQPQTARYVSRDSGEEEGGYTPRSPTAGLPDTPHDTFYHQQNMAPRPPVRVKTRNGSTDGLGMRSLDPSAFEQTPSSTALPTPLSDRPSQFVESRRPVQDLQPQYHPQPQLVQQHQQQHQVQQHQQQHQVQQHQVQQHHQQHQHNQQRYTHDLHNGRYAQPQVYPDDFQSYGEDAASSYIQSYLQSPRPDAPIPPTPRSQSAAPSPSPLISEGYNLGGKSLPFSPVAPVGSPYPYPFSHVRRNQPVNGPNRPHYDPNHPSAIQEQLAKQWQVYAQNNHGNVTDSTLSPSSTPFPAAAYNPWALWHTNRMGRVHDTTSLQSSPSHEPIPLPPPPRKKDRLARRQASSRKPPPRVDSTQPRETSPEPSSSGEETAGEERFSVPPPEVINNGNGNHHHWPANGTVPIVPTADDDPDWIDEQEEGDDDDLLELEYHPNYISNVEKRRRKWEVGWEALVQAFQNLDRQTDATMVLLAAPSHSTKLHSLRSRAVRRHPALANSSSMSDLRTGFKRIATQRRSTRSTKSSVIDRLINCNSTSGDGSDGSSESREEDLRHLLETALGSLGVLGGIFEQRESRWVEEMQRINEDRDRVELLLTQVLGENHTTLRSPRVVNVQGP
ncbi:hypothetical protein K443DRAFT_99269 [Laccaria amethystina LaAM-08-1]|uniref:Uncharacterized protein n=1 Tax=Laccaria amethystina LaAM-08-1 TaxID=1095629 RepID=A0A0C9XTP6_9AGAR|nr:hypothetical protein K443DRAFT_99269 [Laccaria amethystina LaAM-08-1]